MDLWLRNGRGRRDTGIERQKERTGGSRCANITPALQKGRRRITIIRKVNRMMKSRVVNNNEWRVRENGLRGGLRNCGLDLTTDPQTVSHTGLAVTAP